MLALQSLFSLIYWYFRPFVKWFLRKTTRLCELQRICYGEQSGAPRTLAVEECLNKSRNIDIRGLSLLCETKGNDLKNNLQYAVMTVVKIKKINPQVHLQFVKSFGKCMEQIWGYITLTRNVEKLCKTKYDCDNEEHEEKLYKLWSLLVPDIELEARVTKQWQDIGFQGDDPKTDFRGMGMLGLENLLYFATEYNNVARNILSRSQHPKHGYTFAIVGINLTHMAYELVKDGSARTHVYNSTRSPPTIKTFHQLYCYLFIEFDKFWFQSKPVNIMDFSFIKNKFDNSVRTSLTNPQTIFRVNLVIDNV